MNSRKNNPNTLKALMKSENLSKLMKDALSSPVGSTSRIRAKKILNVMGKVNKNDGAGGPGLQFPMQQVQPKSYDYSNFYIMPGTPKIRIPIGDSAPEPIAPSSQPQDGAGGPGFSSNPMDILQQGARTNMFGNIQVGGQPSAPTTSPIQAPTQPGGSTLSGLKNLFNPVSDSAKAAIGAMGLNFNKSASGQGQPAQQSPAPTQGQQQGPQQPPAPQQSSQQSYQGGGSTATQGGGVTPPPGPSSRFPNIQGAVDSNMGPNMYAYQALSNPDYLKSLPGFENLPESAFSQSPLLSGRIQELDNTLRKNYQLDELLNQYTGLVNQGVGLQGRLTDYIRGRDEFLNETDGMLENFKDEMLTMNLADPEIQKSASMYSNYLYEMRGRQNKRYIEFLDTSIDQYNGKLESVSNMYSTALEGYKSELATKAAMTQEEYQLMFGALTDMYQATADAPMKALELQTMQAQLYAAQVSAAADAAKMYGSDSTADGYVETYKNLESVGAIVDGKWNPNGFSSLAVDNPAYFFAAMNDAGRAAMTQPDKDGVYPDIDQVLKTGKNMVEHISNQVSAGNLDGAMASEQINNIYGLMTGSISKQGKLNDQTSIASIESAAKYLSGNGKGDYTWFLGKGKMPTQTEFKTKFSGQGLDDRFLDALYNDASEATDKGSWGTNFLKDPSNNLLNSFLNKSL